jgi:Peptidase_C39 like family
MSTPVAARDSLVLDVPFVPQGEALCGGAAAAMVLRYWGTRGIDAADFTPLVEDSLGGIRTGRLVADLQRRGWQAIAFAGDERMIRHHLGAGRPVIALLLDRPRRYHYVVLVAWKDDVVLLHDPARAPFRVVSAREFDRAWMATGRWSLLVLPGSEAKPPQGGADSPLATITPPPGTFASLVAEGVRLGRGGDLEGAWSHLQAATALWPDSAAAWRELAGTGPLARRRNRPGPGGPAARASVAQGWCDSRRHLRPIVVERWFRNGLPALATGPNSDGGGLLR